MCINQLLDLGARFVKPLTTYPDRKKVSGRMWGGECTLELDHRVFYFKLWHHGSEDETNESLTPHFSLDGIKCPEASWDAHWHYRRIANGILYHPTGWFGFSPEAVALKEQLVRPKTTEELLELGFNWLVKFN